MCPEDFSMVKGSLEGLKVTSPADSLVMVREALNAENEVASDMIAINAGAAIYVSGQVKDLSSGVIMAQDVIGGGLASEKLKEFVDFTVQLGVAE